MAHRTAASRSSGGTESARLLRLVHDSGERHTKLAPAPARLFLVDALEAAADERSGAPLARRVLALLYLLLPHLPVI